MGMVLPILPSGRLSATIGPAVPATTTLGSEVRSSLPTGLVEALDRVGDQIKIDVLDPLLGSADLQELTGTFARLFAKFRDYYVSTVLILWANLEGDPQRFSALTLGTFRVSQNLISQHGPKWIGEDGTSSALQGLATTIRIAKASTNLVVTPQTTASIQPSQEIAEHWATSLIAFSMAFSGVLSSLSALASGKATTARLENIVTLAHWSRTYAARAYHSAKVMGLLRAPGPPPFRAAQRQGEGMVELPLTETTDEDVALAEAGLADYHRLIREEEL